MTAHITPTARLIGLSGSLRRESYSTAVLRSLAKSLAPEVAFEIREPQLPLYNEDDDGETASAEVTLFRAAVSACDGVIIATPEYNHGMPGVLKNVLDWLSRPLGKAALTGKPVLVISTSPAFTGGVRAQAQVHDTLLAVGARIIPEPQIVIGNVADKVSQGHLVDDSSLAFARAAIDRMVQAISVIAAVRSRRLVKIELPPNDVGWIEPRNLRRNCKTN